jgi:hypothetical protein
MAIDDHKVANEDSEPLKPYALHRVLLTGSGIELIKRIATFDTLEEATAHPLRAQWQYVVKHNDEIVWPPSLVGGPN